MRFTLCEIGTFRVFDLTFRTKAELVPRAPKFEGNLAPNRIRHADDALEIRIRLTKERGIVTALAV